MKTDFICPQCNGHMLVGDRIIFIATTRKDQKSGIVLLHPDVGNYTSIIHPDFKIEKDEEVDFFCPICNFRLNVKEEDENLVRVIMVDDKSNNYEIYFSGITGEHCTYKVSKEKVEQFGDSSEKYLKYFMSHRI